MRLFMYAMLFIYVQAKNLQPMLARFLERLQLRGVESDGQKECSRLQARLAEFLFLHGMKYIDFPPSCQVTERACLLSHDLHHAFRFDLGFSHNSTPSPATSGWKFRLDLRCVGNSVTRKNTGISRGSVGIA
ncbi:hypothetical protein C8R45DRAFT_931035 [Mycena sanguinolenta]|nr:hypothetical protein C8R45DRAFT_931035 [Mycena sanguinolenta]